MDGRLIAAIAACPTTKASNIPTRQPKDELSAGATPVFGRFAKVRISTSLVARLPHEMQTCGNDSRVSNRFKSKDMSGICPTIARSLNPFVRERRRCAAKATCRSAASRSLGLLAARDFFAERNFEAHLLDQPVVCFRRLSLRRQIIADEDRVGGVEAEALEAAKV